MEVGLAARKDIRTSIQGKGPIDVVAQSSGSRTWRSKLGIIRSMGGDMPKAIWTWADGKAVVVGTRYRKQRYFELFQMGSAVRKRTGHENANAWSYYATMEGHKTYNPDRPETKSDRDFRDDYWRWKEGYPMRKSRAIPPSVPARPIIEPYSRWTGLHDRLAKAVIRRLAKMFERAKKAA